ncbi:MAG: vanadium-dependent haloperoxidase [Pseudomonadales bacterium]|nr:vanadium-dependent haloperoxidase [Pseudomonadales bacterium]
MYSAIRKPIFTALSLVLMSSTLVSCLWLSDNDTHQSVARQWNEVLLDAIRNDYARPTVHARNLFHISAAMYDAWASVRSPEEPFLFGKTVATYHCAADPIPTPNDVNAFQEKAVSFAAYRIIRHRFLNSPGAEDIALAAENLMNVLGYDIANKSDDYSEGSAAALGNYIANCYLAFGLQDGANESNDYANIFYEPVNPNIEPELPGNPDIIDWNRWQPIALTLFIDQAGNPITGAPEFLGPEWGSVVPFALRDEDKTIYSTAEGSYSVYYDPGVPPYIEDEKVATKDYNEYKWNFALVAVWSGQLDESDGVMIDISPASIGSVQPIPASFEDYDTFYNLLEGGDSASGYDVNPKTGRAYEPQMVPRGDYGRVLAEFWADGPDSETPPGHWFVLLNSVSDHPLLRKRWQGVGDILSNFEWDIKTYFTMGGAMHDAAVAAWGIKGYYDYLRPVSAIRAMAAAGQSTDSALASYHVDGIPLIDNHIALVTAGDSLAGDADENVGKIKIFAWRGPDYIVDTEVDQAGVDWILAENWWPYQRPTFVTPPFAGYISGHSTFSRAAALLMGEMTGDEFFPGGKSGFEVKKNEFLVFEQGPSVDMTLEWATYIDASDQCSLSRIWGGIHPPADDLPGRLIGEKIGPAAFAHANSYFDGTNL